MIFLTQSPGREARVSIAGSAKIGAVTVDAWGVSLIGVDQLVEYVVECCPLLVAEAGAP